MANKNFNIRPGIYVLPNRGRINCTDTISDAQAMDLYLYSKLPFITLTEDGVKLLQNQKLSVKELSSLIMRSTSLEEVELLSQVKESKPLQRIVEQRLEALKLELK